jgi:hypothetical protein
MKIIRAFYDKLDVTNILNDRIIDDKLYVQVSNDIFTDPNDGVIKNLYVKYEIDEKILEINVKEGDFLNLAKRKFEYLDLKVSFICTTYRRFRCVERIVAQYHAQTYKNKELIIFNTDEEYPYSLGFEDDSIIIINNGINYLTNKPYETRGEICRDAVTHATGDYFMLADDDDIYLPWHMQQAVEGIQGLGSDAWKPEASLFALTEGIQLSQNVMEASIIVKMNRIREIGFRTDITGYEGLSWVTKLDNEKQLDQHNKNYIPSYCFNWSDPYDMGGHKQSGFIDTLNNFENHKLASKDYANRPLFRLSDFQINSVYKKYYNFIESNLNILNKYYYERYAKEFISRNKN